MNQQTLTDKQVIDMIQGGGALRNKALHFIYVQWKKSARAILMASGGLLHDVEDAIQESVVVLDNHVRNFRYESTGSLKNYFIGICKGRLYSNKRSTKRIDWSDDHLKMDGVETQEPETLMLETEQKNVLGNLLNGLDSKCQDVLQLYKLCYSMNEIAEELELGNANNARQWVFKCRTRLSKLVAKHPSFSEYFKT